MELRSDRYCCGGTGRAGLRRPRGNYLFTDLSFGEQKVKEHKKLSDHARTCRSTLKLYRQYKEAKNPKLFRERHSSEISRFEASWRQLKKAGYKKVPSAKFMKERGDRLLSAIERCRTDYAHAQDRCNEASSISDTITKAYNRAWERNGFDFNIGQIRQAQMVPELTR